MKKTFKYIMTVAVVLTGLLQLVSCKDSNNDWTTDPSVTKQRPPTSLSVEVDSATLDLSVQIGTIANAASYDLQISESPLTSNASLPVEGEVFTISNIKEADFVNGKITIARKNDQFEVKNNTTYYFRVRAIGKDNTVSNWYTNGMLYYGGIGNEKTAQKMKENTYYKLDIPTMIWVGDNDIDPDALTISWYEVDFATVAKIREEASGAEVDASEATQSEEYTKTKVWFYKWDGLEANKEYTFTLRDSENNVIATIVKATETAPNMSLAHSILSWEKSDVIGVKGESKTVWDSDNYFAITFNEESAANAGWTNTGKYYCQTPDKKVYTSPYRVQSKNTNTLEVKVPEDGRLYLYANGSPTTYVVSKYMGIDADTQEDVWEEIQRVTVKKDDKISIVDDGGSSRNCFKFVKIKLSGATDGKYKLAPTASKSCYFYGFVFVPSDTNAGE